MTIVSSGATQLWDYRQGKDYRWANQIVTNNGACQGLSIYWVINTANKIPYLEWLGPPQVASLKGGINPPKRGEEMDGVIRVMKQQAKVFKLPNPDGKINMRAINMKWATDRIAKCERGGGSTNLTADGDLVVLNNAPCLNVGKEVASKSGYVFFGFYLNGWGGHACAAYIHSDGDINFFDPNFGEYYIKGVSLFTTWFSKELMEKMYNTNKCDQAEVQHFK